MPPTTPKPDGNDWLRDIAVTARDALVEQGQTLAVLKANAATIDREHITCRTERVRQHEMLEVRVKMNEIAIEGLRVRVIGWAAGGAILGGSIVSVVVQLLLRHVP